MIETQLPLPHIRLIFCCEMIPIIKGVSFW